MDQTDQFLSGRFFIEHRFDDFDAFTEAARSWDLDFYQLDRGRFNADLVQYGAPGGQVGRAGFNRRLNQSGAPPDGLRTFVVPARSHLALRWRSQRVSGDDLMIFPEGGELESVSDATFEVFTISLDSRVIEEAAKDLESDGAMRFLRSRKELLRLCPASLDRMRELAGTLLGHISDGQVACRSVAEESERLLFQELPRAILRGIEESLSTRARRPAPSAWVRSRALAVANEVIAESTDVPLTVAQLCQVTGASERTLQYAFRETYGLTPKQYLRAHRLNRVRKRLRLADPDNTVIADVANECGFWHMGQFAKDFRTLFGELPSTTLRKRERVGRGEAAIF